MKNTLLKRIISAVVALALVGASIPAGIGSGGVFDRFVLTASAESDDRVQIISILRTDNTEAKSTILIDKPNAAAGETVTLTVNTADGETPHEGDFNGYPFHDGLFVMAGDYEEGYEGVTLTSSGNNSYTFVMSNKTVYVFGMFELTDPTVNEYTVSFDDFDTYNQRGRLEYGRYVVNPSNNQLEQAADFSPAHEGDTIRIGISYFGYDTRYIVESMYYSYTDGNNENQTVDITVTNTDDANLFYSGEFAMPAYDVSIGIIYQGAHAVYLDSMGYALSTDKMSAVTDETVTLTAGKDYVINSITVDCNGTSIPVTNNGDGTYSFTMPDGDVTVSADYSYDFYYVERHWSTTDNEVVSSEEDIDSSSAQYLTPESTWLGNNVWYLVNSDMTISGRVTIGGTANIILKDGVTLTCSKGIAVNAGNTLNIYGQSKDTGRLVAGSDKYNAAIGSDDQDEDSGENGGGTINIYGGTIEATSSTDAAGIGGGNEAGNGNITIYGGTVTANGGKYGAGIGTGDDPETTAGTITIYGGVVTAHGGYYGAGIGSGHKGAMNSTVLIAGGTVNATGDNQGAGIGSGYNGAESTGSITINGGTVNATGGTLGAAGIGTGARTDCNMNIVINGGNVTAVSTDVRDWEQWGGAGIGSGYHSDFKGTITINGGVVRAEGSGYGYSGGAEWYGAAGIGSGYEGSVTENATITINDGEVTAIGRGSAAAIGSGHEGPDLAYYGGECEGTISILGGTVNAKLDYMENTTLAEDPDKLSIIGRGNQRDLSGNDDTDGILIFAKDMKVYFEGSAPVLASERAATMRLSVPTMLHITECDHPGFTYTATENTHKKCCAYCSTEFTAEAHNMEDYQCIVCGYQSELCNVGFSANGGSGSMDAVTVVKNQSYILPNCGFTEPEGKVFKCWSVNSADKNPGEKITVTADTTVTAVWQNTYSVTIADNIENGTVTANKATAVKGETVVLTIAPGRGYKLGNVTINGTVLVSTDGMYLFTMPEGNVTLSANFVESYELLLGQNTVHVIEEDEDERWVDYTFTPETDGYYVFYSSDSSGLDPRARLHGSGVDIDIDDQDTASNDFRIVAELTAGKEYTLSVTDSAGEGGSFSVYVEKRTKRNINTVECENGSFAVLVNGDEADEAYTGDVVELKPTPDSSYKFSGWTVTDSEENNVPVLDGMAADYYDCDYCFIMPDSDVEVAAEFENLVSVKGTSLTLGGEIGVNVYVEADSELEYGGYVLITGPNIDGEEKIEFSNAVKTADGYKFSATAYSTQMSDNVTVKVFDGDDVQLDLAYMRGSEKTVGAVYTTSVARYINSAQNSTNPELADLAKTMNDYGAYAERYFDKPATLTPGQIEIGNITADTVSDYAISKTGTAPEGFSYYGTSLVLMERTSIKLYFKYTGETLPVVTLTDGNTETQLTPVQNNSAYYVEISNISSLDLDKTYTVRFGDSYTVDVSAFSYVCTVLDTFSDNAEKINLVNLCKTLYQYNRAAETYFATL